MTDLVVQEPVVEQTLVVEAAVVETEIVVGEPLIFNAVKGHAGLWTGEGVPTTVIGASIGDEYLDVISGNLYELRPGS